MLTQLNTAIVEFSAFADRHGPGHGHGPGGPGGPWNGDDWGGGFAWWPIFPLTWLLIWGAVITIAVLLFRRQARRNRLAAAQAPIRSAEAVLAERYARGEVTDEEYRQRLETLRGNPGPTPEKPS